MTSDSTKIFYEKHARDYFLATYRADLDYLWGKATARLKPGALLLDLGCGSGRDLLYFSRQGFCVVGLDYSMKLLKLAKGLSCQPVVLADFAALPFRDSSFDAVWAVGALLHVPPTLLSSVLRQIHRVLKPGSLIFTSMKKGHGAGYDSLGRYQVLYQKGEWERLLREHGFDLIESEGVIESRENIYRELNEVCWVVCLARAVKPED